MRWPWVSRKKYEQQNRNYQDILEEFVNLVAEIKRLKHLLSEEQAYSLRLGAALAGVRLEKPAMQQHYENLVK
jgi:hypothetical protein